MALELWTSGDLYSVQSDDRLNPVPSFMLDKYFTQTHYSDTKQILFSKLPGRNRKMAPFVRPQVQGKPILERQTETVTSFQPAYIKPKDAIRPEEFSSRGRGELLRGRELSLQERFDGATAQALADHRRAIQMRWAHMGARSVIDAKYRFKYEGDEGSPYEDVVLDFARDPNHTVTMLGDLWLDPDHDILSDIQGWLNTGAQTAFGGVFTEMFVGSAVAPVFGRNTRLRKEMDTTYRGNDVNIRTGLQAPLQVAGAPVRLGNLGGVNGGLEVYSYSDFVQNDDGSAVPLLKPGEVFLSAPGVDGVRAFGAIMDAESLESVDIFPKQWLNQDPSAVFLMSQSAPVMIPQNPNRTFQATVIPSAN